MGKKHCYILSHQQTFSLFAPKKQYPANQGNYWLGHILQRKGTWSCHRS